MISAPPTVTVDVPPTVTNEQKLLRAIEEWVDPEEYRGKNCCYCVIGQVAAKIGKKYNHKLAIAEHFGVKYETLHDIYYKACDPRYVGDFPLFLEEYIRPLLNGGGND